MGRVLIIEVPFHPVEGGPRRLPPTRADARSHSAAGSRRGSAAVVVAWDLSGVGVEWPSSPPGSPFWLPVGAAVPRPRAARGRDMKDAEKGSWVSRIAALQDAKTYAELNWEGSFEDYLEIVRKNPKVTRTAFQRIYDMILSHGKTRVHRQQEEAHPLPLLPDETLRRQGRDLRPRRPADAAGERLQVRRPGLRHREARHPAARPGRLLQVHHRPPAEEGPRGVLARRPRAPLYTFAWTLDKKLPDGTVVKREDEVPDARGAAAPHSRASGARKVFAELNAGRESGYTDPDRRRAVPVLPLRLQGADDAVQRRLGRRSIEHVSVNRLHLREKDRVGIGTFQPKDEKNQDSTELTGDINYRKIAEYGSDSDPRAFNFDGEFNIANRGIIEFIEVLKLDVAFLYDLLGASQEHKIKPKKFAADGHRRGHPRPHQRARVQEAPEQRVHGGVARPHGEDRHPVHHQARTTRSRSTRRTSTPEQIKGKHIAPHTIEMAAMWAVLTRLEEPKKAQPHAAAEAQALQRQDAARLHRGQHQGAAQGGRRARAWTASRPRYIQDKISNALVRDKGEGCINPFMVLNELEAGLQAPLPDHQRGAAQALPRAARRR